MPSFRRQEWKSLICFGNVLNAVKKPKAFCLSPQSTPSTWFCNFPHLLTSKNISSHRAKSFSLQPIIFHFTYLKHNFCTQTMRTFTITRASLPKIILLKIEKRFEVECSIKQQNFLTCFAVHLWTFANLRKNHFFIIQIHAKFYNFPVSKHRMNANPTIHC